MERIENHSAAREFEQAVVLEKSQKKKLAKSFINNAGIFMGVLLMFAVVVIVTTDIHLNSFEEIAALGLDFFLLFFLSYSMYVNCEDSGMRAGLNSDIYNNGLTAYETKKRYIIDQKMQSRLADFCCFYIEDELEHSRTNVLATVGLPFELYMEKYVGKDKSYVRRDRSLSRTQKKAIIKANEITAIRLTPEMIMRRGRGSARRAPLGMRPEMKKTINYGTKFIKTLFIALATSVIVLEAVAEPTWVIIATCCLKLVTVATNGFSGYKFGYENIVFDTVNYMSDQSDLMEEAIHYIEERPLIKPSLVEIPEE